MRRHEADGTGEHESSEMHQARQVIHELRTELATLRSAYMRLFMIFLDIVKRQGK